MSDWTIKAKEFVEASRPEPLKCSYCGEPISSIPMAHGFSQQCSVNRGGHVYMVTVGGTTESHEASYIKRLAEFGQIVEHELANRAIKAQ